VTDGQPGRAGRGGVFYFFGLDFFCAMKTPQNLNSILYLDCNAPPVRTSRKVCLVEQ
jgi:hypothetical protein